MSCPVFSKRGVQPPTLKEKRSIDTTKVNHYPPLKEKKNNTACNGGIPAGWSCTNDTLTSPNGIPA
ncbi:hypothetical protein AAZX31_19G104300 [Glycine max]